MAYRRIRFRNCRIQNSDARLVFEERKFFHITPVLRAPPPHFHTFEAPSPPPPHFYLFPPLTPHFYCFLSNTTFTTFHCFPSHMYTHTISTFLLFSIHHLHQISFVFPAPPPPPQFYCFPSTIITITSFLLFSSTTANTLLWFLNRYTHHISIVSLHHYLHHIPNCFPSTTTTTFLLFFLHHLHHISIVLLSPLHQYQISKVFPSCTTTL